MDQKERSEKTRERILSEAEKLFAQKGYRGVNIREITNEAQCNLAAVNYHFGNKENLYIEVFKSRWLPRALYLQDAFRKYFYGSEDKSLKTFIKSLASAFLESPFTEEELYSHHQLLAREIAYQTSAFNLIVENAIRPFFRELIEILKEILPFEVNEKDLYLDLLSLFAMVLYFNYARPFVSHLTGEKYSPAFKSLLVEQIVHFGLHGMNRGNSNK